jgi:YbbR domain-containing protein
MCLPSAGLCTDIYKIQQQNGNIIFTDQPGPTAERIKLPSPMVMMNDSTEAVQSQTSSKKSAFSYQSVTIESPINDAIIRENAGNVKVNVSIEPDVIEQYNHQIVVYLDQREVERGYARSITLKNVDRGTHELEVRIEDSQGNTHLISTRRLFHLQRYHQNQ